MTAQFLQQNNKRPDNESYEHNEGILLDLSVRVTSFKSYQLQYHTAHYHKPHPSHPKNCDSPPGIRTRPPRLTRHEQQRQVGLGDPLEQSLHVQGGQVERHSRRQSSLQVSVGLEGRLELLCGGGGGEEVRSGQGEFSGRYFTAEFIDTKARPYRY